MAWTSPMTATAGSAFTAADFNTFVRDNLNETAVAKATTAGRIFVSTGLNSLAERAIATQAVGSGNDPCTSGSYTDLGIFGPSVTLTTGTSALVFWSARWQAAGALDNAAYVSVDITGATTTSADDSYALIHDAPVGNSYRASMSHMFTNSLTAGSNTFTLKYKIGQTASPNLINFLRREIFVIPL